MNPPILLVEDSEDDYEAITRAFKKAQIHNPVYWCRSGQEALDFLRQENHATPNGIPRPGLILLDLNMPGLDGRKTLRMLKEDGELKHIPVAILSTSNDERNIKNCYQMGASLYVEKSVDFNAFVEDIRQLEKYWISCGRPQGEYYDGN